MAIGCSDSAHGSCITGAGAPIEADETYVTPEMIEAGVRAYYENAVEGWDNPGNAQLRSMMRTIFEAMSSSFHPKR